jgi:hypothetical protein
MGHIASVKKEGFIRNEDGNPEGKRLFIKFNSRRENNNSTAHLIEI